MINLLPPQRAAAIRYGRQNTHIRKWLVGMAVAISGLILIMFSGWIYINQQAASLQKSIDLTNQQLKAQNLSKVQSDAKEITGDIRVINQVLGSEIRFSQLIQTIGEDMPSGSVLQSLSVGQVNGAIDLTASAKDSNAAAQIAANLSDPKNGLFTKVDLLSVNCGNSTNSTYVCTTELKALFSPTVKTQFLSVPKENKS